MLQGVLFFHDSQLTLLHKLILQSCVGWYTFRSPPLNEHPYNRTGKSKVSLCPDSDPLDCIPSLRAVVTKYPYAHFFICSLDSLHTGITVYFLLVRSLPVGVDRAFDDTVRPFSSVCTKLTILTIAQSDHLNNL